MVKILIKRKVSADKAERLEQVLIELRRHTVNQAGYICGETLQRIDRPGQVLVISTWETVDHWRRWVLDPQRVAIQEKIDDLLGFPTDYEIYAHRP